MKFGKTVEAFELLAHETVDWVMNAGFGKHMKVEDLVECLKNMVMEEVPVNMREQLEVRVRTVIENLVARRI